MYIFTYETNKVDRRRTIHSFHSFICSLPTQQDCRTVLPVGIEINRHFLENEFGDQSYFFCCFEPSNKFLYVK